MRRSSTSGKSRSGSIRILPIEAEWSSCRLAVSPPFCSSAKFLIFAGGPSAAPALIDAGQKLDAMWEYQFAACVRLGMPKAGYTDEGDVRYFRDGFFHQWKNG